MDLSYLYTGLLCLSLIIGIEGRRTTSPPGVCTFSRVYKMLGADCSGLNSVAIPNINRDIEVLDASYNRIRVLKNDSFTTYYYLKFLYLGDNIITIIEPDAFTPLASLEVLDLSLNSITNLPSSLPATLRRLYIAENPLQAVPLGRASSLQFVSLANSYLKVLPDMGELPQLQELNLTGNPLENIVVQQLASFCHLETLRLPYQLLHQKYTSSCDCLRVSTWIIKHSIFVEPQINCTVVDENECITNSTAEERAFEACQKAYQQQAATHWAVLACTAIVVFVCAIVLTILWYRRWRKPPPSPEPSQEEVRKRRLLEKTHSKNSLKF